jgi:hypothetical protein
MYRKVINILERIRNAKTYLQELNSLEEYFNLKQTVKDSIEYRLK